MPLMATNEAGQSEKTKASLYEANTFTHDQLAESILNVIIEADGGSMREDIYAQMLECEQATQILTNKVPITARE